FMGVTLLLDLLQQPGGLNAYLSRYDAAAWEYLVFLLKPFGWLSLAGPAPLLVAVPSLLLNFLGPLVGNELPVRPQAWYAASVLPLVALAALEGMDHLLRAAKWVGWERQALRVLPLVLLAGALAAVLSESPLPFSRSQYVEPRWLYYVDGRSRAVAELSSLIPREASVSAEFFVGSHLLNRPQLSWFPRRWQEAEYIALDLGARFPLSSQDLAIVARLRESPDHELVFERDGLLAFRRQTQPEGESVRQSARRGAP
ncbi:MAG: DUF2079 domain-containing protein, partial [Chloroflexi bacterium]|nr:DUF2079 domain-containing protein [Chloroflexota bacterium]